MKIVTLTLNPAFDVHCNADNFRPYHESFVEVTSRDAGGKGVNVSRALNAVGCENVAIVIVGDENGDEFCRILEEDGLKTEAVRCKGRIRENITLHESNNPETRISFGGFCVEPSVLDEIARRIGRVDGDTVITFTGSIPCGISASEVLEMLSHFKEQGARIVIDSRSVSLDELVEFKPWLVKPNKDEAEGYFGKAINGFEDAVEVAEKLHSLGIENATISLGERGAVLASSAGTFCAEAPRVEVLSTIGAGDSSIAGFVYGYVNKKNAPESLALAVVFGTAACMREGTKPPILDDIKIIENKVAVSKV